MTKKLETKKLVTQLEIVSRKTKKNIWKKIAEILQKPTRHNLNVSIEKINKIAKKNSKKILLVPGKILSQGELEEKTTIVGVNISTKALEKISKKGKFIYLKDFIKEKVNVKEIILVK